MTTSCMPQGARRLARREPVAWERAAGVVMVVLSLGPARTASATEGSPSWRTGWPAATPQVLLQHHTTRFRLALQLGKALSVPTLAVHKPGSAWIEPPRTMSAGAEPARSRPPRLRPRLDRPAVPQRVTRLPCRGRSDAPASPGSSAASSPHPIPYVRQSPGRGGQVLPGSAGHH